jgi:hypothetical protein
MKIIQVASVLATTTLSTWYRFGGSLEDGPDETLLPIKMESVPPLSRRDHRVGNVEPEKAVIWATGATNTVRRTS